MCGKHQFNDANDEKDFEVLLLLSKLFILSKFIYYLLESEFREENSIE